MKKCAIICSLALLLFLSDPAHSQSTMDEFFVSVGSEILTGGGTGFNNGCWYVYPSGWINEWYYINAILLPHVNIVHIEFDWMSLDPLYPTNITVALNWSTPEWSYFGFFFTMPPLPEELPGPEENYIIRHTFFDFCGTATDLQHVVFDMICYPMEWVSIGVTGSNFEITNGTIVHECSVGSEQSSWGAIKALQR